MNLSRQIFTTRTEFTRTRARVAGTPMWTRALSPVKAAVVQQRSASRIGIAITECAKTVTALAKRFASTESVVMRDEDPSYASFERLFADHRTVNHL